MNKITDTKFVYFVDGDTCFGNIQDYAQSKMNAYYAGLEISDYVIYWQKEECHRLEVERKVSDFNERDYAYAQVSVIVPGGDDEDFEVIGNYTIDGRA